MMTTLDMTKPWHEQTAQARAMIKEEDFYKVARMLGYKIKIEKGVDKSIPMCYNKYIK